MVVTHVNLNSLRSRWGKLVAGIRERGDVVILEFHGRPAVALVRYPEYERYVRWLESQSALADNPP